MKRLYIISLGLILIVICSCNSKTEKASIVVGMTYDEVEEILKKPISITRGANELHYDIEKIPYDIIRKLNFDEDSLSNDSLRWIAPHHVRTVGNLIYVSWVYDNIKIDTFYVVCDSYKTIHDTINRKIPIYFLGDRKVSKTEYLSSDGFDYKLHDNSRVKKTIYDVYKKSGLYKLPSPIKIEKKIKYRKDISIKTSEVKDSVENKYYAVMNQYCVVFDASSGRVTNSGFFPFYINEL